MTEYIKISPACSLPICDPTSQQSAVYDFYERRHSDDASDIYSPEWSQRTRSFLEQFAQQHGRPTTLRSWDMVEDLDFGAFFLAHPIAAFALWHVLQACYELDRAVCGASTEKLQDTSAWQEMKPFRYLKSEMIHATWVESLNLLKSEIESGALEGNALVRALYNILCGVERLENTFAALRESFSINLKNLMYVDKMLDEIARGVDDRCRMIVDMLDLEDDNASISHTEDSMDRALEDHPHDSAANEPSGEPFLFPANGPSASLIAFVCFVFESVLAFSWAMLAR